LGIDGRLGIAIWTDASASGGRLGIASGARG
jgi:hypothetical protein